MHSGVICHADDKSAADACVGEGEEGIRRNIQPDVFHGTGGTRTRKRGTERDLHGDLFVGRPFAVDLIIVCGKFSDFGGWRSGIGRNYPASRLKQSSGNRLVADHHFFHRVPLFG